jgi:ankyrin repeat protein
MPNKYTIFSLAVVFLLVSIIGNADSSAVSSSGQPPAVLSKSIPTLSKPVPKASLPLSQVDIQFVQAGGRSDLEAVKLLLSKHAHVNAMLNGKTALIGASLYGNFTLCSYLLNHGADPNLRGGNAPTALTNAVEARSASVIKLLIKHGAKVNEEGGYGETPLMRTALNNEPVFVSLLISLGANPNYYPSNGEPALVGAISKGHLNVAKLLVAKGAHVNSTGASGFTPLLVAAYYGNANAVKYLLSKGASTSSQTISGQTPLALSVYASSLDSVQSLIAAGESITERDVRGNTPIMISAAISATPKGGGIFSAIEGMSSLASLEIKNDSGQSALMFACYYQAYTAANSLLDSGVSSAGVDRNKQDALQYLAGASSQSMFLSEKIRPPKFEWDRNKCKDLAKRLAKSLPDADVQKGLLTACKMGRLGVAQGCLDGGASPDSSLLSNLRTALMIAAENGNCDVESELIKRGASLTSKDVHGDTALDIAIAAHQNQAADLLRDAMKNASGK